jgi:hypothetical protein
VNCTEKGVSSSLGTSTYHPGCVGSCQRCHRQPNHKNTNWQEGRVECGIYVVSFNSSWGDVDAVARRSAIEKHGEMCLDLVCGGSGGHGRIMLQVGAQGKRPSTMDEERQSSALHLAPILPKLLRLQSVVPFFAPKFLCQYIFAEEGTTLAEVPASWCIWCGDSPLAECSPPPRLALCLLWPHRCCCCLRTTLKRRGSGLMLMMWMI